MARNKYKGIIYQSKNSWICGVTRFVVTKHLDDYKFIVKLLDMPDYQSANCELKPGYAQVSQRSVDNCKILQDNRNITEYIKDILFE